jgi:hypothetical protein
MEGSVSRNNPRFPEKLERFLSDARTVILLLVWFALDIYALYEVVRNHIR